MSKSKQEAIERFLEVLDPPKSLLPELRVQASKNSEKFLRRRIKELKEVSQKKGVR